jgi:protein-tyrosine phosphatase
MHDPFSSGAWDAAQAVELASAARWDVTRITGWLSVGGLIEDDEEAAWLHASGVTHVICVAAELDDALLCATHDFGYYHVPWPDDGMAKPTRDFLETSEWLAGAEAALAEQGRRMHVLLHCVAGAYRSPLLATFLLAAREGLSVRAAYALLRERRPAVSCFEERAYRRSCFDAVAAAQTARQNAE